MRNGAVKRAGFGGSAAFDADPASRATILSDLSANIFAALLIILILLLQIKAAADSDPPPVHPVDASHAMPIRPHAAMRAAEIVSMLHARAPDAPGPGFDLVEAGLRRADDAPTAGARDLEGALKAASAAGPVRLYVFSNRWFGQATALLAAAGRTWRDLSVPQALRDAADTDAWSPEFLALLSRRQDEASFRAGLARLLAAAPGPLVPAGHVAAGAGGAAGSAGEPARPTTWLSALSTVLGLSALASGAILVTFTEGRAWRTISGASRATSERS